MSDNRVGRPNKLPKFLEVMKDVLSDDRTVILTDKELLVLCNNKLPLQDRIGLSTFEFWKSESITRNSPEEKKDLPNELVEEFRHVLSYARVNQKLNLTDRILDPTSKNAYGSTWVMERKFEDMKLHRDININHNPTVLISASSDEHKKLIEAIMNNEEIEEIGYEEVPPEQLENE